METKMHFVLLFVSGLFVLHTCHQNPELEYIRRVMVKMVHLTHSRKPSVYTEMLGSADRDRLMQIPGSKIKGLGLDADFAALKGLLGDEMYSVFYDGARACMDKRAVRFETLRKDLESRFGAETYKISINLDGCNDCCTVTNKRSGERLFVKVCKQEDEAIMNCFVSSVLQSVSEGVVAKSHLMRTVPYTYVISQDVGAARTLGCRFLFMKGHEYTNTENARRYSGRMSAWKRRRRRRDQGDECIYSTSDSLVLLMMWMVLRLADGHGHNMGVIIGGTRDDAIGTGNRVIAFDIELHRKPTVLRKIRECEVLVDYIASNVQKYYNNTFVRYLVRALKNSCVGDRDVALVFYRMRRKIIEHFKGLGCTSREIDECGFLALIEEAIQSLGEARNDKERKCIDALKANKAVWLTNYRNLKNAVISRSGRDLLMQLHF